VAERPGFGEVVGGPDDPSISLRGARTGEEVTRMRTPGFTAEAVFDNSSGHHRMAGMAVGFDAGSREGKIIPQQECFTQNGQCTGVWPFYRGQQCETSELGTGNRHCCRAAGTWPYIRECALPEGGFELVEAGCAGPCIS